MNNIQSRKKFLKKIVKHDNSCHFDLLILAPESTGRGRTHESK